MEVLFDSAFARHRKQYAVYRFVWCVSRLVSLLWKYWEPYGAGITAYMEGETLAYLLHGEAESFLRS
jgi:hypothetical protein